MIYLHHLDMEPLVKKYKPKRLAKTQQAIANATASGAIGALIGGKPHEVEKKKSFWNEETSKRKKQYLESEEREGTKKPKKRKKEKHHRGESSKELQDTTVTRKRSDTAGASGWSLSCSSVVCSCCSELKCPIQLTVSLP